VFCDLKQRYVSGDDCTGEVHSLIFKGESPRSGLNWLHLAMSLSRYCFESEVFLQGENLRSMIGRRQRLCTVTFLEASLLEKLNFWCYLGGVTIVVLRSGSL
jgi:hypothetical protein